MLWGCDPNGRKCLGYRGDRFRYRKNGGNRALVDATTVELCAVVRRDGTRARGRAARPGGFRSGGADRDIAGRCHRDPYAKLDTDGVRDPFGDNLRFGRCLGGGHICCDIRHLGHEYCNASFDGDACPVGHRYRNATIDTEGDRHEHASGICDDRRHGHLRFNRLGDGQPGADRGRYLSCHARHAVA